MYLAIVAIWAGVLIPRWLRRDHSVSEQVPDADGAPVEEDSFVDEFSAEDFSGEEEESPAPRRREMLRAEAARFDARAGMRPERISEVRSGVRDEVRTDVRAEVRAGSRDEVPDEPRWGAAWEAEHKRVVTARRRLLWMLLVLTVGSATLAVTKLAAWWVIIPPTVMLAGYLLLLREGAKADAERRELDRAREARMAARSAPVKAPVVQPVVPPAPDAEVIEMPASPRRVGEEFFDQYADAKLRAVGD